MKKQLPINCAARNALWSYDRAVQPRFAGAPVITETTRSYEMPDIAAVPEGSDITVELYGGTLTIRLDGFLHRISIERFEWVRFPNEAEARAALLELWRAIEKCESIGETQKNAGKWRDSWTKLADTNFTTERQSLTDKKE